MKKLLLIVLLVCSTLGAKLLGQTYSLEECVSLALANNTQVTNSDLDVSAIGYRIREIKSALLPTIEATGQSVYYKDLPAQYVNASAFGGPEGAYNKMTLSMKQNTSANIQMNQNLFNQSVVVGLKAAKVAREAALVAGEYTKENIVFNVSATYYSIQVLQDNLIRLDSNISNLEKTVEINKVLKDNELIADNVYNRMLINLDNLKNQREIQKLQIDELHTTLKFLMNKDADELLQVESFNYAEVIAMPQQFDLNDRADIRLQQTQLTLSQYDRKIVKAGYFPVLVNTWSLGYNGFNTEFGPFQPINDDWIRNSYVAMTLKIPVFDGFKKSNQMRQKEIEIQKNLNTLSAMKLNANKEVEDARTNFEANTRLLESSRHSLDLAEALFISAQAEYSSGLTSSSDLLNAQNDLSNARNNYSAALLNLKLAELELKKSSGTLLSSLN
ncbi:MAG: TolC family protein [Cyclobacteriaceae bacterium]